jgi:heat shock protein HspQ
MSVGRLESDESAPDSGGGGGTRVRFSPGQLVHHARFGYRGVVVDVDATFQLSDEWYEEVARSRPAKDQPWYHVLVHDADHMTYVAQRHLEDDPTGEPIRHPMLGEFFSGFRDGRYTIDRQIN